MSRYTTQLRYIIENCAGLTVSAGYSDIDKTIEAARPVIFDFDYPIFDTEYKPVLEQKILMHFYTREIGLETYGLWKLKLTAKMREIMPFYNQFYKSELLEYNPLYDVDLTRSSNTDATGNTDVTTSDSSSTETSDNATTETTSTETGTGTNTTTENKASDSKELYSDTPQGSISNIESNTYLTNATLRNGTDNTTQNISAHSNSENSTNSETTRNVDSETTSNGKTNTKASNITDYLETVKGKQGSTSFSELLMKYRETFMNIDMLVINDLEELFIQLW